MSTRDHRTEIDIPARLALGATDMPGIPTPCVGALARAIPTWPVTERPRERLFRLGAAALSDSELLSIFVRTGTRSHTAVDIARLLLRRFGSLRNLLNATPEKLMNISGIGPAKIAQIKAIEEIVRRSLATDVEYGPTLDCAQRIGDFLRLTIAQRPHEVFLTLFLDTKMRLIRVEEAASGGLTRAVVYPREIVRRALDHNAAMMIVAHNHPSGDPTPSTPDRELTLKLKSTLSQIDVLLIDHFIITSNGYVSFAEHGWI